LHARADEASLQGCKRHLGLQDFARDSGGQLRNSQDNSFWNSLSTLGNDLFYSPNPSPAGQTKSAGETPASHMLALIPSAVVQAVFPSLLCSPASAGHSVAERNVTALICTVKPQMSRDYVEARLCLAEPNSHADAQQQEQAREHLSGAPGSSKESAATAAKTDASSAEGAASKVRKDVCSTQLIAKGECVFAW
jgi:hypothetical protein